jgi:hypothetical protein
VMTGYAEPFATRWLPSPVRHDKGAVIAYHHDSLENSVDLSPYCVWSDCPDCGRGELFYLHQRKKGRSRYFSFSTGHGLVVKGDVIEQAAKPAAALGMEPLGSVRAAASSGWRATWADLAPRRHRVAARLVDLTVAAAIAALGWVVAVLFQLPLWQTALVALALLCLYEPVSVLNGATLGKRLIRIEAISTWDGRALGRDDALRRALSFDVQLLFPPLIIRNLAWLLWDPARQCSHDRRAASIVISGRSRPGQKL